MLRGMAKRELLTAVQVAELIGIGEAGVRKHARNGELPGYLVGRLWRFDAREVDAWMRARKSRGPRKTAVRRRPR